MVFQLAREFGALPHERVNRVFVFHQFALCQYPAHMADLG